MKLNLSDNQLHLTFAPLTLTKPIAELRMGILTNAERYKLLYPEVEIGYKTEDYLQPKFPALETDLTVNANVIPNDDFICACINLGINESLKLDNETLALRGTGDKIVHYKGIVPVIIRKRWDLFELNHLVLESDFKIITKNKKSETLSETNTIIGKSTNLFIEVGAKIECAILNTESGPIYIGKNAEIMEGSTIRGGLALCENSVLKMGTKIYGSTTIGPGCKIGGELNNVIFQSNSNKAHDGFLGNSIIGEWCNLGADTNCSNLKNNYSHVSTFDYTSNSEEKTEIQFMGITMGDYSKCGINTMFNTGSVIGVSCNVFGADFPKKFLPSFSWGTDHEIVFKLDKVIEAINNMMFRRGKKLDKNEIDILSHLFSKIN